MQVAEIREGLPLSRVSRRVWVLFRDAASFVCDQDSQVCAPVPYGELIDDALHRHVRG